MSAPEASRLTEHSAEDVAGVTHSEGSITRHLLACTLVPLGAIAGYILGKKPAPAVIPVDLYDTYRILSTAGVEAEPEQPQEAIPPKAPVVVEKSYAKIIENIEKKYMKDDKEIPNIQIGDTVVVGVRIREGEKERVQDYTGVVICMRNGGLHKSITVRAVLQGVGVERVFPVHAAQVAYIRILKRAKVRRAKLYYLRDRFGKAARLKQRFEKSAKA